MNLYWSIYKNLEREVKHLANVIHFCDKQNMVYSIHIADLIIRTSIEIEAISKELYKNNGGNMNASEIHENVNSLFFDSDCIQFLDEKWKITKKVINVVSSNFYFEKEENLILRPLKNCNKQGEGRWKKAYQALKHNRYGSLESGNIANLIRALAALYLLNLYKKDISIKKENSNNTFDLSMGSEIFSVESYNATTLNMNEIMSDASIESRNTETEKLYSRDSSVYIEKYTENSFIEMHKNFVKDSKITKKNFINSIEIQLFLQKHPEHRSKSINEICVLCGEEIEKIRLGLPAENSECSIEQKKLIEQSGLNMLRKIISFRHIITGEKAQTELVLNKCQTIYPCLQS